MRGLRLRAIALLFFSTACRADTFPITVETYPPNAALHDQFGGFLGRSGMPLQLQWDRENGPLQLKVSLEEHQSVTKTVTLRELQKPRYPEHGVIDLPADSMLVWLKDLLAHRLALVIGILAGAVGVAVLAWKALRRRGELPSAALQTVGGYQLVEPIGQGGMSEVFRAQSLEHPNSPPVALKLMHLEIGSNPEAVERFQREIKAHLALLHPNLPAVHDWGEHPDGRLYLVMELLQGETLRDRLRRQPPLSDAEIADILRALGAALDFLHGKGYVHRDVKPSNVFLGPRGVVKLMDMGIAQGQELAPLTRTGMAVGTPHYMAPEQARGQALAASDQYAMGVMAFEMLAGRRPFSGSDPAELLHKHVNAPVPSLSEFRPGAPRELQEAVHRILAKNPNARYPDAGAAASAVCSGLGEELSDNTSTSTSAFDPDLGT